MCNCYTNTNPDHPEISVWRITTRSFLYIQLLLSLPILLQLSPASAIPLRTDPAISPSDSANTTTYRRGPIMYP